MTMNNILTGSGLSAMSFLTICIFRKYVERLFSNQQNAIANFKPCIELLFTPWQVVYKYYNKSFINKYTFFNFVPQLIKKTYCERAKRNFIDLRAR